MTPSMRVPPSRFHQGFLAGVVACAAALYGLGYLPGLKPPVHPASAPVEAPARERWATVSRVIDGDTVELQTREHVRLIGVDTPELHHPTKGEQPGGREAKAFTKRLVEGKRVRLEADVQPRDRYGRTLAYIFLEDGTCVNAELLSQGYARLLTIPPNVAHVDQFVALEREAVAQRRGLWALLPDTAPFKQRAP